MKERTRPDGSTYLSGRDVERDQAHKWAAEQERRAADNVTHHLVPRAGVMRCAYCKKVNVSTDDVCPAAPGAGS